MAKTKKDAEVKFEEEPEYLCSDCCAISEVKGGRSKTEMFVLIPLFVLLFLMVTFSGMWIWAKLVLLSYVVYGGYVALKD